MPRWCLIGPSALAGRIHRLAGKRALGPAPLPARRRPGGARRPLPHGDRRPVPALAASLSSSASSSGSWLGSIIARASPNAIHRASATSGKRCILPLRGGHSISKSIERIPPDRGRLRPRTPRRSCRQPAYRREPKGHGCRAAFQSPPRTRAARLRRAPRHARSCLSGSSRRLRPCCARTGRQA